MKVMGDSLDKILGVNPRTRYKEGVDSLDQFFTTPIIHRQIHGDEIYVPLDLNRIWNQC
jgi:hypothetical protein